MKVIDIETGRPIFSWCKDVESEAIQQMEIIAKLPFVRHVALMPDGHLGANMCIGGVVATEGILVPDFCGQDAGCGMASIRTSLIKSDMEDLSLRQKILHSFSRSIPVGFSHNSDNREKQLLNEYRKEILSIISESNVKDYEKYNPIGNDLERNITSSVATLGGG